MMPVVKWCAQRNMLGVFTRVHVNKHGSVFHLGRRYEKMNEYALDHISAHVNRSNVPSCELKKCDIVALKDLKPGDEITVYKSPREQTRFGVSFGKTLRKNERVRSGSY